MVKGVVKRIVILRPGPETGFEQAIFIAGDNELTGEDLVAEACRIAASCLREKGTRRFKGKKAGFCFAGAGAAVFAIFMLVFHFIM